MDDLNDFYSQIDLCIFNPITEEAFGRVLVESIIYNTPVIAHNISATKEIISNSNYLNTYNSIEEMQLRIIDYFDSPEKYPITELKANMKNKYDINKVIQFIQTHFESLINE